MSRCHTKDRDNMRAQKDSCGIKVENDDWRFAVDKMFNVTYWPYIQNNTQYLRIQQIFGDSFENLSLDFSLMNVCLSSSVLILVSIISLSF